MPGCRRSSAAEQCAAIHSPCELGTIRSPVPCMISVGAVISARSKPHGRRHFAPVAGFQSVAGMENSTHSVSVSSMCPDLISVKLALCLSSVIYRL